MSHEPSLNVRLYGTEEEPEAQQTIVTGSLSVVLQSGNLRNITLGRHEAIRSIAFVVRDKDWGTFNPTIFDLEVDQQSDRFCVSYRAECGNDQQTLAYSAVISGSADGTLEFVVTGGARTDFLTSRTGFVVLHPIDGVAGHDVTVTHTDGSIKQSLFPVRIKPSQPFSDIRALTHSFAPGLSVTCTMEGDAFEMEDQRNWTDASYKTYIRPLSKPHPFTLEPGKEFIQRVALDVDGRVEPTGGSSLDDSVTVRVRQEALGKLPEFALAVHPDYLDEAIGAVDLVRRSRVGHLYCTFDTSAGHDAVVMGRFKQLAEATGTAMVLEAVLSLRDDDGQFTNDVDVLDAEISAIRNAADEAGIEISMISASPACYLKSYQPSGPWPKALPLELVYSKVRNAFPAAAIAAGMHSFFTEFNRRPPPAKVADVITHSTCPIVHASDDLSVMETLQALPWVFASARDYGGDRPYWIGPTAIGMRFNPYGSTTMTNPDNRRGTMVTLDPRQRGLFNAAWTLGYIARAVAGCVDGLCLSAVAGPFGIAWQEMDWDQPWFDETGIATAVFPVYHVIAGLGPRTGASLRTVECSNEAALAAIAFETDDGSELWLANLTAELLTARIVGVGSRIMVERLDSETFQQCCSGADALSATATAMSSDTVYLHAYAVLRISAAAPAEDGDLVRTV